MRVIIIIAGILVATTLFAQKNKNWQILDPTKDKVYGTGSEEAYKTLNGRKSKTVIVAVIDAGVQIDHEDLKDVIWTNPGEIPNNGIDDDNNGYIDDINGWSFLGGKTEDINHEATELARLYQKMKNKFTKLDTTKLSVEDAKEYTYFKKIESDFNKEQKTQEEQLKGVATFYDFLSKIRKQNNDSLTKDAIKNYTPENELEGKLKKSMKLFSVLGLSPEMLYTQVKQGYDIMSNQVKFNNSNIDSIRRAIVGDNPDDMTERYYGCNRVQGPDAFHGTHVSGIIAAMRYNNLGIIGIANDVKIMVLRAVPNGDERDKDIANSIRYAVDNGASIINMSFGKYYSPDKKLIDEAVKYAMSKDVLLIHAAGNESKDNDVELSYPSRELLSGEIADNWIQVGASSSKKGKKIIGTFSNYGKKKVDLFAPGVDIYSTIINNKYSNASGTSMAAPSVAGVAAIIRAYFPELKANEVRNLLMKTVVPYKKKVKVPGTKKDKKRLSELCISGGFVNANNAVLELLKKAK